MTQPDPQPDAGTVEPDGDLEVFDPDAHPHPLRARDVAALIAQELG